jgi:hypothetical protein
MGEISQSRQRNSSIGVANKRRPSFGFVRNGRSTARCGTAGSAAAVLRVALYDQRVFGEHGRPCKLNGRFSRPMDYPSINAENSYAFFVFPDF